MTALTIDPVDHWVDLNPQPIRQPLREEMYRAADEAIETADPLRKAFFTGLFTGYGVAFGLTTREALDRARNTPFASNHHIDFRKPRPAADDEDILWACGVRHGYYLGTSERPDAIECALDGERLTDDDETESCEHGTFCDGGCIRDWHGSDLRLGSCEFFQDREWE